MATTTQAADLAREVGGGRARASSALLPPNADPHDHEVRPDDVKALADAALVVRSGGEVDAWLEDAIDERRAPTRRRCSLIDHVRARRATARSTRTGGRTRATAIRAVAAMRARAASAPTRPARAGYRRARRARLTRRLEALDAAVAACLARGPAGRGASSSPRTTRSGYYAARYGLDVVGAVIPSLSTPGAAVGGRDARR